MNGLNVNDKVLRKFTLLYAKDRISFLKSSSEDVLKSFAELCINAKLLTTKVDGKTKNNFIPLLVYFSNKKKSQYISTISLRKFFCLNYVALCKLVTYVHAA